MNVLDNSLRVQEHGFWKCGELEQTRGDRVVGVKGHVEGDVVLLGEGLRRGSLIARINSEYLDPAFVVRRDVLCQLWNLSLTRLAPTREEDQYRGVPIRPRCLLCSTCETTGAERRDLRSLQRRFWTTARVGDLATGDNRDDCD